MNAEAHIVPALGYLPLQPLTPALPQHRARQAEERLAVGPRWQDSGLVFTWPDGRPLHPERFSRWFEQLTRAVGLPRIRLHDVRHSYAADQEPARPVDKALTPGRPHAEGGEGRTRWSGGG
jgi:hypothetical protein